MTDILYKRAPITEAVVEFRYTPSSSVIEKKQEKAFKKLKPFYLDHRKVTQKNYEVKISHTGDPVTSFTDVIKNQFSSENMTQILTISPSSFLASQLAPYQGWETFFQRIKRDWEMWEKYTGFHDVKRVGMRYINRMDIPMTIPVTEYEDFTTVYPTLPKALDPCLSNSINVKVELDEIKSILNLNTAVVLSPIPDHMAIVIDIDISRKFESPQSKTDLLDFINTVRKKKNDIFESCITDKARELFNR